MAMYSKDTVAHLQGDLTHSGVTRNIINSLASCLHRITAGNEKNIRIDCGKVRAADISGMQLLYVWMQCARFRGVEPELINLPDSLQRAMQRMGIGHCFAGTAAT